MRRRCIFLGLVILGGVSLAGCKTHPLDLVVLHTNDTLGFTEQATWQRPFRGGLARRAGVIKTERAENRNALLLDAGNALWSEQELAKKTQGQVIIEAMNRMGYDAMAIGDQDLRLGPDVLRQRIAEAQFPVLSANVQLPDSGELLAQPYVIREVGGRQVGIIGLTSDFASLTLGDAARPYTILTANEVLPQYIAELAKKANIIVVLSNMGYEEDQHLSSQVPGIDLIVGGRTQVELDGGWRNEQTGTIVVQAGTKGGWLGRCQLRLDGSGEVTRHSCELLFLTAEYPDDPDMRAFLESYPSP